MKQTSKKILKVLSFFRLKIYLFFMCCFILGCVKTVNTKTNTIGGIKYIEPKKCELKKINVKKYNTEIIDNKLFFNTENLGIFIQNMNNYKLSVKEFEMCHNANEAYYKNVISEIVK